MAGPIVAALPGKELIKVAPALVEIARKLYKDVSERRRKPSNQTQTGETNNLAVLSEGLAEAQSRLEILEADGSVQAELIAQMATQQEALTIGLQSLVLRVTVLLWLSSGAALAGIVALVIAIT